MSRGEKICPKKRADMLASIQDTAEQLLDQCLEAGWVDFKLHINVKVPLDFSEWMDWSVDTIENAKRNGL